MCADSMIFSGFTSVPFFTQIRLPSASVSMLSTYGATSSRMTAATGSSSPDGATGLSTFFNNSNIIILLYLREAQGALPLDPTRDAVP